MSGITQVQSGWETPSFMKHERIESLNNLRFLRSPVVLAPVAAFGINAGKSNPIAHFLSGTMVFLGLFGKNFKLHIKKFVQSNEENNFVKLAQYPLNRLNFQSHVPGKNFHARSSRSFRSIF
jgi:hypothetical protein